MKPSLILTLALAMLPLSAFSEEARITCVSSDGKVKVEAVKLGWTSPYPRLDTDIMVVKREGQPNISDTVHAMTLNNNLIVLNEDRYTGGDLMRINMGRMNDENFYPRSKLILKREVRPGHDDRTPKPIDEKIDLKCIVTEDLGVSNVCTEEDEKFYNEKLMTAVKTFDVDGLEQAIACGADVNIVNEAGCSALMTMIDVNGRECKSIEGLPGQNDSFKYMKAEYLFQMLIDEGASTEYVDVKGESVAHKVVNYGLSKLIPILKINDADLDLQDKQGVTPIMRAVLNHSRSAVTALLEAEVDLTIKNVLGLTAYDMSVHLPANLRSMLKPSRSSLGLVIKGEANGSCSPTTINVKMSKPTIITLKSSPTDMFMLTAPDLGIELMANAGGTASKNITINKMGTFKFECGVHGGRQTEGKIIIIH